MNQKYSHCRLPCFSAKGIMCTIQKQYSIYLGSDFLVFPFLQTIKTNTIGTLNMLGEIFIFQSCLCQYVHYTRLLLVHVFPLSADTHQQSKQSLRFYACQLIACRHAVLCSWEITHKNYFVFSFEGLAKRVHARLLLASTSEVYGGQFMLTISK